MALMVSIWELVTRQDKTSSAIPPDRLVALHYNHGISAFSDQWQQHCQRLCDRLAVPIRNGAWPAELPPLITEADARSARYRWFDQQLESDQVLLTAHHRDDQAETILMNLFQGAGPERLAGIPPLRSLGVVGGPLVCRPLLDVCRSELEQYLRPLGYKWIDDPANTDYRHARNFVRHKVLPLIRQQWPDASDGINRSGHSIARVNRMVAVTFDRLLDALESPDRRRLFCLCPPLRLDPEGIFSSDQMVELIRHWLIKAHYKPVKIQQLNSVLNLISDDIRDRDNLPVTEKLRHCRIQWDDLQIREFGGHLFLMPAVLPAPGSDTDISAKSQLALDYLKIKFVAAKSKGIDQSWFDNGLLKWRWRRGGEKIRLPGRVHHTSLKKAYQQADVPAWERYRLPYLVLDDEIVWADGIGPCGSATESATGRPQVLPLISLAVKQ